MSHLVPDGIERGVTQPEIRRDIDDLRAPRQKRGDQVHGFPARERHERDLRVPPDAFRIDRDHGLIDEAAQVGIEAGHALALLGFGSDMNDLDLGVHSEKPHRLRPPIP